MQLQKRYDFSYNLFESLGVGVLPTFEEFEVVANEIPSYLYQSKCNFIFGLLSYFKENTIEYSVKEVAHTVTSYDFNYFNDKRFIGVLYDLQKNYDIDSFVHFNYFKADENVDTIIANFTFAKELRLPKDFIQVLFSEEHFALNFDNKIVELAFLFSNKISAEDFKELLSKDANLREKKVLEHLIKYLKTGQFLKLEDSISMLLPNLPKKQSTTFNSLFTNLYPYEISSVLNILIKHKENSTNFYQSLSRMSIEEFNVFNKTYFSIRKPSFGIEDSSANTIIYVLDEYFDLSSFNLSLLIEITKLNINSYNYDSFEPFLEEAIGLASDVHTKLPNDLVLPLLKKHFVSNTDNQSLANTSGNSFAHLVEGDLLF